MNTTVLDVGQGTPEWQAIRAGRLTSSRAPDMLAKVKTGEAAGRRNLRVQMALERIVGRNLDRVISTPAMLDGTAREGAALARYESHCGELVTRVGFVACDDLLAGWSPDGLVGDDGAVEAKCTEHSAHYAALKSRTIPTAYQTQMVHALWVSGRAWCDWVSYQPDWPEDLQLLVLRFARDEDRIAEYDSAARAFLAEVDDEYRAVMALRGK